MKSPKEANITSGGSRYDICRALVYICHLLWEWKREWKSVYIQNEGGDVETEGK